MLKNENEEGSNKSSQSWAKLSYNEGLNANICTLRKGQNMKVKKYNSTIAYVYMHHETILSNKI